MLIASPILGLLLLLSPLQGGTPSDPTSPNDQIRRILEDATPALERVSSEAGESLVRVGAYRVFQMKTPDGRVIRELSYEEGLCHGVVITHEPKVVISMSSMDIEASGNVHLPVQGGRNPNMSERQYYFLLSDDRRIEAEMVKVDELNNVGLLRPRDRSAVEPELSHPIDASKSRRLVRHDACVLPMFGDITHSTRIYAFRSVFPDGLDSYARPAMLRMGLAQLGCPLFTADGEFAGFLNLPPKAEETPAVRVVPFDSSGPAGRDPKEWNTGVRRPLLFGADEVVPWLQAEKDAYSRPVPISGLGFTLKNVGLEARVAHTEPGSKLELGDVIDSINKLPVHSVDRFLDAMEEEFEMGAETLHLLVSRNGTKVDIELHP